MTSRPPERSVSPVETQITVHSQAQVRGYGQSRVIYFSIFQISARGLRSMLGGGRARPASSHFRSRVEPDERRARWRYTSAPDTGPRRTSPITLLSACVAPFSFWSVLSKAFHLAILRGYAHHACRHTHATWRPQFRERQALSFSSRASTSRTCWPILSLCIWCAIRRHAHISIRHSHLLAHTSEHRLSSYLSAAVPNEYARS